jgi:hypothetical protein
MAGESSRAMPEKLVLRSSRGRTAEDDERLRELLLKGMDAQEVGSRLGRTVTAVPIPWLSFEHPGMEAHSFTVDDWERKLSRLKQVAEGPPAAQ